MLVNKVGCFTDVVFEIVELQVCFGLAVLNGFSLSASCATRKSAVGVGKVEFPLTIAYCL